MLCPDILLYHLQAAGAIALGCCWRWWRLPSPILLGSSMQDYFVVEMWSSVGVCLLQVMEIRICFGRSLNGALAVFGLQGLDFDVSPWFFPCVNGGRRTCNTDWPRKFSGVQVRGIRSFGIQRIQYAPVNCCICESICKGAM
ncbi:hypothetical protein GOP47_0014975 [Adiantum capillus-veneris]|uniref:Uncharacterized protein n=1 Tax=Adiantum capillus-veneris TaxID=13818 RepID=A0A9D4UNC7_ADICA|nr:hypothetical protein GOP47_0014975 [Adiantum capillus-veneris]